MIPPNTWANTVINTWDTIPNIKSIIQTLFLKEMDKQKSNYKEYYQKVIQDNLINYENITEEEKLIKINQISSNRYIPNMRDVIPQNEYLYLREIQMINFRQYKDISIKLSALNNKNIQIFIGKNGTGKTTLMNAITWCFFGEEKFQHKIDDSIKNSLSNRIPLNFQVLENAKNGELLTIKVILNFGSKNNNLIKRRFERTVTYLKKGKDLEQQNISYKVGKTTHNGIVYEIGESAKSETDKIIKNRFYNFFFFDGEKLHSLFKSDMEKQIKSFVQLLSGLEILDRIIERLNNTKAGVITKQKKISKNQKGSILIIEEHEKILKNINKYKNKKNDITDKVSSLKSKKLELDSQRIQYSSSRHKDMVEKEKKLKEDKKNNKEEINKLCSNWLKLSKFSILSLLGKDISIKFNSLIDEFKIKDKWPSYINMSLINHILNDNKCICGDDLSENNIQVLKKELQLNEVSKTNDIILETRLKLNHYCNDKINENNSQMIKFYENYKRISDYLDNIEIELNDIKNDLLSFNIENINKIENDYHEIEKELDKTNIELGRIERDLKELISNEKILYKKKKHASKNDKESSILNQIETLSIDTIQVLNKIKDTLLIDLKNIVQNETKEMFGSTIWDRDTFSKDKILEINDDFEMKVYNRDGYEFLRLLSAGQTNVLAMSFITAIGKISGLDMPLIIDTPLARIDLDQRGYLGESLSKQFTDRQIIFFLTDAEYSDDFRASIEDKIENKFHLQKSEGMTIIVKEEV